MSSVSRDLSVFTDKTLPVIQSFLSGLDTPISLSIKLLLDATINGDEEAYSQLADYSLPISSYLAADVDRFRRDYQASVLLSKLPNFLGRDLEVKALESFSSAEYQCSLVNQSFLSGDRGIHFRDETGLKFDDIKHKLSRILGRVPSLEKVVALGGWGPGSTYALNRRMASPEYKCEYENTITYKLAVRLSEISFDDQMPWFNKPWSLVPGNLITTVPKNLKTDRTIAIEPGINSWCQKGVGMAIRRRLKKFGINLNDQTFNSYAALEALSCDFCTIDLKAASDSISLEFLRRVCPSDWLQLIELTRSERGSFSKRHTEDKKWFEYHKVSSMGNGFTFELESALFFSIMLACGVPEELCYVYGDDLIFPRSFYDIVTRALSGCGFVVNSEKSFHTGLFYESCGAYSFNGVDVTPLKIKELLHGPKDCIVLANKIRLFSHLSCHNSGCSRRYLPAWRLCVSGLPDPLRRLVRGPVGSGLTLFCNLNETTARYSRQRGSFRAYQLVPKIKEKKASFHILLQYRIYQLSTIRENFNEWDITSTSYGNVVKAFPTGEFKQARLYVEKWYHFGDWI